MDEDIAAEMEKALSFGGVLEFHKTSGGNFVLELIPDGETHRIAGSGPTLFDALTHLNCWIGQRTRNRDWLRERKQEKGGSSVPT